MDASASFSLSSIIENYVIYTCLSGAKMINNLKVSVTMLSGLKMIEIAALILFCISLDYSVYKVETIIGQYSSVTYCLSEASA